MENTNQENVKEQVSEIPTQETESEKSSQSATVEETSSTEGKVIASSEEVMIPHEIGSGTKKLTQEEVVNHIMSPDEVARIEGSPSEAKVDLSKIEFDGNGIPVVTPNDIDVIKKVGFEFGDINLSIETARNEITESSEMLNEKTQKEKDRNLRTELKEIRLKIKSLKEVVEQTEEQKNELKELTDREEYIIADLQTIPINNPELKKELETKKRAAVNLLAMYQNVARKDIKSIIESGSMSGLIDSTTIAVFKSAYTEAKVQLHEGVNSIYEIPEVEKAIKAKAKIQDRHDQLSFLINSANKYFEQMPNVDKFITEHTSDEEKKMFDELTKALIIMTYSDRFQVNDIKEAEKTYQDYKINFTYVEGVETEEELKEKENKSEEELAKLKEYKIEREKFIENITELFNSIGEVRTLIKILKTSKVVNRGREQFVSDPMLTKIELDNFTTIHYTDLKVGLFDKCIERYKNEYYDEYCKIKEEYDHYEEIITNTEIEFSEKYTPEISKLGLINSILNYSYTRNEKRNEVYRDKSLMDFDHLEAISRKQLNLIKTTASIQNVRAGGDGTLASTSNINMLIMYIPNFFRYMDMLVNSDNFDEKFAYQFDPDSTLKDFFYENEEYVKDFVTKFDEINDYFSHLLVNNAIIQAKYQNMMRKVIDFFDRNTSLVNKLNDKKFDDKKVRDFGILAGLLQKAGRVFRDYSEVDKIHEKITEYLKDKPNITDEEFKKWYDENCLAEEKSITKEVIYFFIELIFAKAFVCAFDDIENHFESKNDNKGLKDSVIKHLYVELLLSLIGLSGCPSDKKFINYIKEKCKGVNFQSIKFEFEKDLDITEYRKDFIANIYTRYIEAFGNFTNSVAKEHELIEEKAKKMSERENKLNEKKNAKILQEKRQREVMKARKEAKKKKRVNLENITKLSNMYKEHFNNPPISSNGISVMKPEGRYFIQCSPSKDTRVIVKVLFEKKFVESMANRDYYDKNVIDASKEISVEKAYRAANIISNEMMNNLAEKWYYNQYIDGKLAIDDNGVSLKPENISKFTLSQLYRFVVKQSLDIAMPDIMNKIEGFIISGGRPFDKTKKVCVIKSNCKFDIKYFNGTKNADYIKNLSDNGNLNFFNSQSWILIAYELNYDIANAPEPKEEKKEVKVVEKKEIKNIIKEEKKEEDPNKPKRPVMSYGKKGNAKHYGTTYSNNNKNYSNKKKYRK